MRRWLVIFLLTPLSFAQAPQTPRQALLEMLRATSPQQIDRHMPEAMVQALAKLPPATRDKQRQAMMMFTMMMSMSGNALQTFDSGPIFAKFEKDGKKVEITVESDSLKGDTDAMEFGIRGYKEDKVQPMPVNTHILISMKREKSVWKLTRIGGSASIDLDDPKIDAMIVQAIQEQQARTNSGRGPGSATKITVAGDVSPEKAIASLRALNAAEARYAARYPGVGYTCNLSDLGGLPNGSPDQHGAQLINPPLEAGTRNGYKFEISGCAGTKSYKIMAVPTPRNLDRRTFCTDQSGVIRGAAEATTDCWAAGEPVS